MYLILHGYIIFDFGFNEKSLVSYARSLNMELLIDLATMGVK